MRIQDKQVGLLLSNMYRLDIDICYRFLKAMVLEDIADIHNAFEVAEQFVIKGLLYINVIVENLLANLSAAFRNFTPNLIKDITQDDMCRAC